MTEKLCFFDKDNQQISGIPTQRLINLYSKWAHGGFGMIITGNLMVDIVSFFQLIFESYLI